MSQISPQAIVEQYRDASNLNARFALHERFSTNKYGWHRWVFDQFDLPQTCDILELGCGPAYLWQKNADRVPAGWRITLSDLTPGMVEQAQHNLRGSEHSLQFRVIDAQAIPCDDNQFDAVIANHMLYHVPDRAQAFSEIRRVLQPGGRLYASTVGHGHLRELDELIVRFVPGADPWGGAPAAPFLLENGEEQLAQWFSQVKLYRYEDSLVITETAPLIAYVLSSMSRSAFVNRVRSQLTEFVAQEISKHGSIHIAKDSGMFEAFSLPTA